jgi:hypothetical protein
VAVECSFGAQFTNSNFLFIYQELLFIKTGLHQGSACFCRVFAQKTLGAWLYCICKHDVDLRVNVEFSAHDLNSDFWLRSIPWPPRRQRNHNLPGVCDGGLLYGLPLLVRLPLSHPHTMTSESPLNVDHVPSRWFRRVYQQLR